MKKRMKIMLAAAALAAVMALTACGRRTESRQSESKQLESQQSESRQPEPQAAEEKTEDAGASEDTKEEAGYPYDEILLRFYRLIFYGNDDHDPADGETGVRELAMVMGPDGVPDCVGYTIQDISGDGIPELLIGYIGEDDGDPRSRQIYAVFTCEEETPRLVLEGWYRNAWYYLGNSRFGNTGSDSAMCSIFGSYTITPDGTSLSCEDYWFTFEKAGGGSGIGCYHNTTGEPDPDVSEELDIDVNEFWQMEEELIGGDGSLLLKELDTYR